MIKVKNTHPFCYKKRLRLRNRVLSSTVERGFMLGQSCTNLGVSNYRISFLSSSRLGEKMVESLKGGGVGGRTGDSDALGKHESSLPSLSPKMVGQDVREGRVSSPRGPHRCQNQGLQQRLQQKTDKTNWGFWWQPVKKLLKEMRMKTYRTKCKCCKGHKTCLNSFWNIAHNQRKLQSSGNITG